MKRVTILGSTGSIGKNTLEVIRHFKEKFKVIGLVAGKNTDLLLKQATEFKPQYVALDSRREYEWFRQQAEHLSVTVLQGEKGAREIAGLEENDIVISAITGIRGLEPTLAAVKAGKRIALANKESMVAGGKLIQEEASRSGAEIIPVDSEHSGVYQCLSKEKLDHVRKVILTASGGPFFKTPKEKLFAVSIEDTLKHPRWKMGAKVTVDSATMMNKGLELIEARWLFGLPPEKLDILIHPQSIVHSLVEMKDGSFLAQLSPTDMKIPIQFALSAPSREEGIIPSLDLARVRSLEFFKVDEEKFPLVNLARKVLAENQSKSVTLNAANEVTVAAFLKGRIDFTRIHQIVMEVVEKHSHQSASTLEDILALDREARIQTQKILERR